MYKNEKTGKLITIILILAAVSFLLVLSLAGSGIRIGEARFGEFVSSSLNEPASRFRYLFSHGRSVLISGSTDPGYTDPAQITVLDVGQGLSVLIEKSGHHILYDGGGRKTSAYLVRYMKSHGITHFDYIIASHYDEDHIGGLIGILNTSEVDAVICPDYQADTEIYCSFMKAVEGSGAAIIYPQVNDTFLADSLILETVGPVLKQYSTENDRSLVFELTYNKFTCLLTGDAESESELALVNSRSPIRSDVLVVSHHGSASSSCRPFIRRVAPRCAVISCGYDNDYGHPAQKTVTSLRKSGAKIYRTDLQGEIRILTDGETFWIPAEEYRYPRLLGGY